MSPALVPVFVSVQDDRGRARVGVDDGAAGLLRTHDVGGRRGRQGAQVDGAKGLWEKVNGLLHLLRAAAVGIKELAWLARVEALMAASSSAISECAMANPSGPVGWMDRWNIS